MTFVTTGQYVIQKCLSFGASEQRTEFLTVWSCHRLPYKKFKFHCFWITVKMWTTWNFKGSKYLHVSILKDMLLKDLSILNPIQDGGHISFNKFSWSWFYRISPDFYLLISNVKLTLSCISNDVPFLSVNVMIISSNSMS